MALLNTDLFFVSRSGNGFKMPASELIDFIAGAEGSLNYRGVVDCVAAAPFAGVNSGMDPNPALAGDIYINTADGTVAAGWTGIVGEDIVNGQRVVFDGTSWAIVGSEGGGGVETVQGTLPITVDSTDDANPVIGINEATNALFGSTRLAQDPPNAGDLTSTADTDVLSVPHFNELAGRITTAAAGGIQSVVGTDPIEVSTDSITHEATVSIKDASLIQKGATTLSSTVVHNGTEETKAVTPKGVSDYSVPLNLAVLDSLP